MSVGMLGLDKPLRKALSCNSVKNMVSRVDHSLAWVNVSNRKPVDIGRSLFIKWHCGKQHHKLYCYKPLRRTPFSVCNFSIGGSSVSHQDLESKFSSSKKIIAPQYWNSISRLDQSFNISSNSKKLYSHVLENYTRGVWLTESIYGCISIIISDVVLIKHVN